MAAKMHDRSDWTQGPEGPRYIRGRSYAHLVEFSRPCATCGQPFSIHVTRKIANGDADTNAFALRNCEDHRRKRGGINGVGEDEKAETESLRAKDKIMSEELDGLYEIERELRSEVEKLLAENAALKAQARHKMPWET